MCYVSLNRAGQCIDAMARSRASVEDVVTSILLSSRERPLRRLQVLIVESDGSSRERIKQALMRDYQVQCAASLSEAWIQLETHAPDILVSELVLGKESGLDLCRAIREHPSLQQLPIMLLTSLATIHDKVTGFEAGADDYLVKPYDTRQLLARIRLLARIKHLEERDT